ncbi:MAG TPA: DUF1127 domain-containing protein [Telmatospirillum sp.]|nr:DUF1127 domain-containing protein [Telmatospirillum sp.]
MTTMAMRKVGLIQPTLISVLFMAIQERVQRYVETYMIYTELSAKSDRLLADMGLRRADIWAVAKGASLNEISANGAVSRF